MRGPHQGDDCTRMSACYSPCIPSQSHPHHLRCTWGTWISPPGTHASCPLARSLPWHAPHRTRACTICPAYKTQGSFCTVQLPQSAAFVQCSFCTVQLLYSAVSAECSFRTVQLLYSAVSAACAQYSFCTVQSVQSVQLVHSAACAQCSQCSQCSLCSLYTVQLL